MAESFTILNNPKFNFISELSKDEFQTFRKRMIGMILATDMARHVTDLSSFKEILERRAIQKGANSDTIIDYSSATKEFDSKQQIIDICLHAADVST